MIAHSPSNPPMPPTSHVRTSTPDILPGFWVETPRRQLHAGSCNHVSSRWWERLLRRAAYEIVTSERGHGLYYTEFRVRYPERRWGIRWSKEQKRYSAICGGAAGVARFLTELRRQQIPLPKHRIVQATRSLDVARLDPSPGRIPATPPARPRIDSPWNRIARALSTISSSIVRPLSRLTSNGSTQS